LTEIDLAFRDTVRPDPNSLVVGDYFEKLEVRDFLLDRQWRDTDVDMLDAYDEHGDLRVMTIFQTPIALAAIGDTWFRIPESAG
jgi:hypothetical protein